MPTAPLALCLEPGCNEFVTSGRCDKHRKARKRVTEKPRPSRHERGYTNDWYKFRKTYLLEHPYCVSPLHAGKGIPATDVDHIDSNYGPLSELAQDPRNLQALCHSCHSTKTALYDGSFGKAKQAMPWSPKQKCATTDCPNLVDSGWCQDCQQKNLAETNITVVAGPPCAGKTTYVQQHMREGDLVVDLDAIAEALGATDGHDKPGTLLPFVYAARDAILERMMQPHDVRHVWVIRTAPTNKERRQWWQANVIVLETPINVCLERAKKRPAKYPAIIKAWYDAYEPNPADQIVTG